MNQSRIRAIGRGLVCGVGIVTLLASLSWVGLVQVITRAEGSLPQHLLAADVIVPLAGSQDRIAYAKSLVEQGIASRIMSTLVDPLCLRAQSLGPSCATHVRNTIDEAVALRRIFDHEHFTRVVVVTSPYHLARASAVFDIVFAGSDTAILFVVPPHADTSNKQTRKEVVSYLPSLFAALLARSVPALYEWTVRGQRVCQELVALFPE